ncbi:HAD family hydrolase [Streptacidiphilus cavernicola]|uniref:HAD family hydrolase n=1 Tax=Streptacidiphilus cavernicola TaxID=3342716 RepID=A0ABV6VMX1_9ACTN
MTEAAVAGGPVLGLLVDWGGVLTTSVFDAFAAFGAREGIAPDAVARLFRADPEARELLVGLETGTLAEAEFERRFGALLGVPADRLIARMLGSLGTDARMCAAVAAARRQGVPTGLVSNSWGLSGYPAELLAELFTGVVISGTVGLRKPAPEIYRLGAESLGLRPDQCVFVDDLPGNLAPARELGMATVHHVSAERTVAELARLLGRDLEERELEESDLEGEERS